MGGAGERRVERLRWVVESVGEAGRWGVVLGSCRELERRGEGEEEVVVAVGATRLA